DGSSVVSLYGADRTEVAMRIWSQKIGMFVEMRTSRDGPRHLPERSTTIVCGRPTGNPIFVSTATHAPEPSRTSSTGVWRPSPACDAATLSLENAYDVHPVRSSTALSPLEPASRV